MSDPPRERPVGRDARSVSRSVIDPLRAVGSTREGLAALAGGPRDGATDQPSASSGRNRLANDARGAIGANSSVAMTFVLAVVLLAGGLSIAYADDLSSGGERSQYTEFSLLTETDDGRLVADGYPTEIRSGESAELHVSIGNHEGGSIAYTVIVKLQRIDGAGESGAVADETELGRFERRVDAGETAVHEHSVRPETTGTDLRLAYLLYKDEPPEDPTMADAYRAVHLRIDVTDE